MLEKPRIDPTYQQAFDLCALKTRSSIKQLADSPKSAALAVDGDYFSFDEGFFDIGNWTSSFFTGMALWAYRATQETCFLEQLARLEPVYLAKVGEHAMDTMHDLGFLYSLYSVGLWKLTGNAAQRALALRAADVLAARFVPAGKYIRAWGRMDEPDTDYAGLAIVDCLMNLPLLLWASDETGEKRYRQIAIAHADTALKTLVRPDDSVCHACRFDLESGLPTVEANYCGRAVGSHWARGTAWAIYGFAIACRYTEDDKYLHAAKRLARTFVCLLDDQGVPVWDFRLGAGEARLRDSSAAAIAVCGMQELERLGEKGFEEARRWLLERLVSAAYLNHDVKTPGVLKNGQVGQGVGFAKNAYTSWGDYFLMEALAHELNLGETFW
jgi:unsaturated chondroitin disaccharide hydrolase